jgi:GNAT superfamily N-acetyltransferase
MAGVVTAFRPQDLAQVSAIFWETAARKMFQSIDERVHFQERYLNLYLENGIALVARLEGEVVGYIIGVTDTLARPDILQHNPHLKNFEDLFKRYPAHLHINCTERVRGQGMGGVLLQAFEAELRKLAVVGVHLITAAGARNISFYNKNGYEHRVERLWEGRSLLFMGKSLSRQQM